MKDDAGLDADGEKVTHLESVAQKLVTEARRLANDDPNRIDLADVMPFLEAAIGENQIEGVSAMRTLVAQQEEALQKAELALEVEKAAQAAHKASENDRRRDSLAAYAMQGLLVSDTVSSNKLIAASAYAVAEAMIAEREKRLAAKAP